MKGEIKKMKEKKEKKEVKKTNKPRRITNARVRSYKNEILPLFGNITDKRRSILIEKIIDKTAFLLAQSDELELRIKNEGSIEIFENGAQKMLREHPASKSYNQVVKNINTSITTLMKLLPNDEEGETALSQFLKK